MDQPKKLKDRIDKNGKTDIKVSAIILVHNNLPLTIDCLESVLMTRPKGMEMEIVLLSNGSDVSTEGWIELQGKIDRGKEVTIKPIILKNNLGFAGGCNEALRHTTGDIVIFLNNDTIVTPGLFTELMVPLVLVDDVAVTAPVSNFAGGVQMIETGYKGRGEMLEFAAANYAHNHNKTMLAGMVTGLCIALRRDTIEKLTGFHVPAGQFFDERFKIGMWEDNDLCLRIQLLAMKCMVCTGAFIHHEGSATFKKMGKAEECFHGNQRIFQKKWKEIFPKYEDQKLVAMIRVKDAEAFIGDCLDSLGWVDEVAILDTGSTDKTLEIIRDRESRGMKIILDAETFRDAPLAEHQERQHLLEMAQGRNPTWIIWMDADHAWEEEIETFLPALMEPTDPQVLCWRFPILNFWRGRDKFRADGAWGQTAAHTFFRHIPGQRLVDNNHPQGFHCPPVPIFQQQNIGFCGVNLLHYGYCDWEEAQRKYNWYQETDTDKRAELIGREDYRHLVDESNLRLITYRRDNSISLSMLFRDGEEAGVKRTIRALETVVREFVLVYTGKGEIDPEILELADDDRVIISKHGWNDAFTSARNFALAQCTGRWVLHLDPDEEISAGDIVLLPGLIQDENAVAYSVRIINWFSDPKSGKTPEANIQQAVRLFRRIPGLVYANPVHETLDDSIKALGLKDEDIPSAPITIFHSGYLCEPRKLREKLEYYADLSLKWIETNPDDPRPYYNLGIHYLDLDDMETALEYLEKARELNNQGKTGLFQVGLALSGIYLRAGIEHTAETILQLPASHPQRDKMIEMLHFLKDRVGNVRHLMKGLPPLPAITPLLQFIKPGMKCAEIGVQQGYSSEKILEAGVGLLVCVDPWADIESYRECRGWNDFSRWEDEAFQRLKKWIKKDGNEVLIYKTTSGRAAKHDFGFLFDFVFLDGNHEEEPVYQDILAWWPQVKEGGILAGHDYYESPDEFHRVKEAVDRWAKETGREVEVYKDCWLVRK